MAAGPLTQHRELFVRYPDFRRLWLAQAVSMIGNRMATVALAIYATVLTGSTAAVGVVLAAQTVPLLILLLVGGVLGDRLRRQRVMAATDVVQAAGFALLAGLIFAGEATIAWLIVLSLTFGAAEGLFRPASVALLPQTVSGDALGSAVAAREIPLTVSWIVGPALAGGLIATAGSAWPFVLNAVSFVVSAVLLSRIRVPAAVPDGDQASFVTDLREGFHELLARRWLYVQLSLHSAVVFAGVASYDAVGPTLSELEFGSAARFGLLTAALGAGLVVGSVLAFRVQPRRMLLANVLGLGCWPLFLSVLAVGAPFEAVLAVAVVNGIGTGLSNAWWETVVAREIPAHLLSRINSYDWLMVSALQPAGLVLFGALGRVADPSTALFAAGATVACALLVALRSVLSQPAGAVHQPQRVEVAGG